MKIGKIIKQKRLELGLTLEEVGNIVGVSKSTVKKWEDGFISNMKRDKIASLAKALKMDPVAFVVEDYAENTNKNNALISKHEQKVLTAYRSQPEMQPAVDKLLGVEQEQQRIKKLA